MRVMGYVESGDIASHLHTSRLQMLSGQLRALDTFRVGKEHLDLIKWEAGWAPELV